MIEKPKRNIQTRSQQHWCIRALDCLEAEAVIMAPAQTIDPSVPSSLLSLQTISDVVALANSTRVLPPQFLLPEASRPDLAHDAYMPDFQLPVFDLSLLAACQTEEEKDRMGAWLSSVCKEWGFFQVVNHGMEPGLMQRMESFGRKFFEMPTSTKEKVEGYKGKFDPSRMHSEFWVECLNLSSSPANFRSGFIDVAWPDGDKEFSDCFGKYVEDMEKLSLKIVELLIESLGVKWSTAMQNFGKGFSGVRYNYYPPCPQPSLALGLSAHTDPNVITILFQDNVGGLQLRGKDGQWRAVKPKADAFILNVGDTLKVLSNGAYRAAEHRAVVNSTSARVSLGFFYNQNRGTIVKPLEQLVNAENPALFEQVGYGNFMESTIAATAPPSVNVVTKLFAGGNGGASIGG